MSDPLEVGMELSEVIGSVYHVGEAERDLADEYRKLAFRYRLTCSALLAASGQNALDVIEQHVAALK